MFELFHYIIILCVLYCYIQYIHIKWLFIQRLGIVFGLHSLGIQVRNYCAIVNKHIIVIYIDFNTIR